MKNWNNRFANEFKKFLESKGVKFATHCQGADIVPYIKRELGDEYEIFTQVSKEHKGQQEEALDIIEQVISKKFYFANVKVDLLDLTEGYFRIHIDTDKFYIIIEDFKIYYGFNNGEEQECKINKSSIKKMFVYLNKDLVL